MYGINHFITKDAPLIVVVSISIEICIFIIINIFEFFTPALAEGFSLEFKSQGASSSIQNSSQ